MRTRIRRRRGRRRRRRLKGSRHRLQPEDGMTSDPISRFFQSQWKKRYLVLCHERCDPCQEVEEEHTQRPPVNRVVVSCVHYSLPRFICTHTGTISRDFFYKYIFQFNAKYWWQFDVLLHLVSERYLWACVEVVTPDGAPEQQRVSHTPKDEGRFRGVVCGVMHSGPAQTSLQPYRARLITSWILQLGLQVRLVKVR